MIRAGFASILTTLFASIALQAAPKLGTDFGVLDSPLPIKKDGKVEVVEAFWYGCGHCYSFEPELTIPIYKLWY